MDRFKEFTRDECVTLRDGLYLFEMQLKEWGTKYPNLEYKKDLSHAMTRELTDEISE